MVFRQPENRLPKDGGGQLTTRGSEKIVSTFKGILGGDNKPARYLCNDTVAGHMSVLEWVIHYGVDHARLGKIPGINKHLAQIESDCGIAPGSRCLLSGAGQRATGSMLSGPRNTN